MGHPTCALLLAAAATRVFATSAHIESQQLGLTQDNLNPRVVATEYAVRGRLLDRARELEASGRSVCKCNIGNPQALGAKPLQWVRSVLSLCVNTELLELAEGGGLPAELYPDDVVARARAYVDAVGSVGAYSESQGVPLVREEVAAFLRERDGVECEAADVFLTDGASAGVRMLMQCLIGESGVDAVLAPSPVYPLYSAMTTLLGGGNALYPLRENFDTGVWTVSVRDLERALAEARARGVRPRALVVINPGNPTGQCMSQDEARPEPSTRSASTPLAGSPPPCIIRRAAHRLPSPRVLLHQVRAVLELAAAEGLVLLADEVYQDNVYNEPGTTRLAHVSNEFHSFRRALAALRRTAPDLAARVQLVTMHSTSKGETPRSPHRTPPRCPEIPRCLPRAGPPCGLLAECAPLRARRAVPRAAGYMGECGLRGGFFALDGAWEPPVRAQLVKLSSVCLCSNVVGQSQRHTQRPQRLDPRR